MDSDERIRRLEAEVRSLREVAEGTRRNTSALLWFLIGLPLAFMVLGAMGAILGPVELLIIVALFIVAFVFARRKTHKES